MKLYLKSIVKQLKHYSDSLDKSSILIDKPWAMIDEEFEMQKLIFKKNKELVLSKNGQVQIGKWDYFPEAKSLLIDRNTDKILCNEAFINEGVMILRLDGTDGRFFMLANENIVPDLDVNKYLTTLRNNYLNIKEVKLIDDTILEIQLPEGWRYPFVDNRVTVEAETIPDGKYPLKHKNELYEIKNGRIYKILREVEYINPEGHEILIQQQSEGVIKKGDYVFMFGKQVENGIINFSKWKNIVVRQGIVIRLERKNEVMRWLSRNLKIALGEYAE